jgi:hypothetical protein
VALQAVRRRSVTRRKRRVRVELIAAGGGRCAVCGYERCAQNLHFHHVDPARKRLELGSHRGASLAVFLNELEKCVLLCANCHGEVEAGIMRSPAPGSVFKTHSESQSIPPPAGLAQSPRRPSSTS